MPSGSNAIIYGSLCLSVSPFQDGNPFTKSDFVTVVGYVLGQMDLNQSLYAGHSFRIKKLQWQSDWSSL